MVQLNATTGVAKYEIQTRGESNDAFDVNEVIHDTYERTKKALRGLPQVLTAITSFASASGHRRQARRKLKLDRTPARRWISTGATPFLYQNNRRIGRAARSMTWPIPGDCRDGLHAARHSDYFAGHPSAVL
jgi:hypothetical protein